MAENNLLHVPMVQLDDTYRELLVKLKTHVTQLALQTDAMLCVKWVQKLQTLTKPDDIKLRNYLISQICNQIRTGYLDHPFINSSYLDQDLNVVANCCREWETMFTTADDVFKMRIERSMTNTMDIVSDCYLSDVEDSMTSGVVRSLAVQNIFQSQNGNWVEPKEFFTKSFENTLQRQNFYQKKYEETLKELKEVRLKLHLRSTRSLEEFVEYIGANIIEKYQNATGELSSMEKRLNGRKEFCAFQLNFCSKFKLMCGELLNPSMAENLIRSEEQFQKMFNQILCNFLESNENRRELVSTDRASISTDLDVNTTKYSDYLKRYIRKQQKQFNRKKQDYESQIAELKNEICLRDKKQSRQIIEMKCENIIRNEQKTRDQLSESINDLESKYKNIVQQIFNEIQEQT